ncbi:transcription-repair coupling factor [Thermoleophilum album]|uniref:Transcription-repair-coupling factor n=1 Tax=Thermoleophilum album TaxID=29539 RepID=A0A1H6FI41_THEAL|nr:transcription-repair coupling factor [Thermoleophilum album]SEH10506.1 transcription-repair coupling factor (superfamily II helicase) [Thermoleophilum album]
MTLRTLTREASEHPAIAALADAARSGPTRAFLSQSIRAFGLAALLEREGRPALIVESDDRAAANLAADLRTLLAPRTVRVLPARGVRYESHLAPPAHLVGLRVAAVDALLDGPGGEAPVVVVSAPALAEKVPDPELRPRGFTLARGELLDLAECAERLVELGYERVEQVEDRGQFAIRGEILDVFPATEERAVRCELFDIEIERLAWFSTFTQRSLGEAEYVEIAPVSELAAEYRARAEIAASADGERPDVAEVLPVERFRRLLELVPDDAFVVAHEDELEGSLFELWEDVEATFADHDLAHLYVHPEELLQELRGRVSLWVSTVAGDQDHLLRAQAAVPVARDLRQAEGELEKLVRSGYRVVVAWARRSELERAALNLERLRARELGAELGQTGALLFTQASLRDGFIWPQGRLALIPEHRLLRRRRAPDAAAQSRRAMRAMTELRSGVAVVHEDHGIARFVGFTTRTVAGVTRDYLELEFRDGDRVFVPSEQLHKVSRYVGADASDPPLSKLGGRQWEQMKLRARRAAEALAGELLTLYAERRRRAGFAFPPDGDWQRQFEASFPYQETPDQLEAIEAVRADMEEARPMDRLVCGDVGYGKTEVALRAAFKAATAGKQVLFLVPTTVLAQQHFNTFRERMRDWPLRVEVASRFRPPAEVRRVLRDFAEGKVDILIGTHRLLSRDVRPHDLGLLIIDEEQRFGVRQKELLRQLRLRVDVLSMSATPIPRTLQMALSGLRDISVIETPPEGRRPVQTYVGEWEEELVRRALHRELERGGQAFYLHNRVETIAEAAERVRALVPEARVEVAHGQMDDEQLEQVMMRFVRGEADVLVCTTIIESGIDIPRANTLIVERADELGLAQLYQIRGRVGRSRERAHAYLLYPSAAALSEQGRQRLATLSDHTELGSGFRIAMRDLEIRGAGNLLGEEQSGHVAAVGFELYVRMLEQAVAELSGEAADEPEPVRLDIPVDAYVPSDYIDYEAAKVDVHRRIAGAREVAELIVLRRELEDRFGPIPEPLENLIKLQDARIKLGRAGVRSVEFRGGRMVVAPLELDSRRVKALRQRLPEAIYESGRSTLRVRVPDDPHERFAAVVRAAEAVLEVASDPATAPTAATPR